ncbi:MAG: hypothetical protein HC910_10235 [Spirulinaceae cyanobacterium SM2_1_0]|nr:hypothetical protein [Spirulinaceae cyanobacterium SM2_1_0]
MAHWVKLSYERQDYVVDLDGVSAFAWTLSGRITFWLPDSALPIVINRQTNPRDYQTLLNYIDLAAASALGSTWLRLSYDRSEYAIDLSRIRSFCYTPNNKLTFWLPDSSLPIILTQQNDPEAYQKVRDFILRKTGQILP